MTGGAGGFGRHVGDLMTMPGREREKGKKKEKETVKKEEHEGKEGPPQVQELGSSEVFGIRGDEVFEMG